MLKRASGLFAAGAVGALANVAAIWLLAKAGAPGPQPGLSLLYKQVAWGGLWGLVFFVPLFDRSWWKKGLIMGLLPALLVLFYFLPERGLGLLGLERGPLVGVRVVFLNVVVWGLATAWWARQVGVLASK